MPEDASDFLRQQVTLDPSKLKAALDAALADGYSGGSLAAVQQLPAGADPGVAALFGPDPKTAWSEWQPGNVEASQLLDDGGFKALLDQSDISIKGITDTTYDRMGTILSGGAASGASVDDIASQLYAILGDSSRASMIATTELARATEAASFDRYGANGVTQWEWILSPDACPYCQEQADANPHNMEDEKPPAHPWCRCASAPVADSIVPQAPTDET